MVRTAEERREAQRRYAKTYRDKHNPVIRNANDKLREIKSVPCDCGGSYKDIKQNRVRHCETAKHLAWDLKTNKIMPLFIEIGKSETLDDADERIENFFKKNRAYTASQQVTLLNKFESQLLKQLGGKSNTIDAYNARSVEPVKKPTKTKREAHHERIIRIAAETQESSSSEEEEPQNEIIEAEKSPPPTPCPSSSEAESEESDEPESESEQTETDESDCSDVSETQTEESDCSDVSETSVEDRNIAFSRRYMASMKSKEVAEKVSAPPPPKIDMNEYLEEASKPNNDGSDILKKLGLLTEDKKGNAKYHFL